MSTDMNSVAGKVRNAGVNTWLVLLALAVLVFGLNTGYATWKGAQLGGASTSASDLRVYSQQLAVHAREAVGGEAAAFEAFNRTRGQIDGTLERLTGQFGSTPGVAGPLEQANATWAPLEQSAAQLAASQEAVLGLAGRADSFTARVPDLQARLDELVRAMSSSGSPSSQVYYALRQVVLSGTMARRVTEIRAGGPAATTASEGLQRDATLFGTVLDGLRSGDEASGVAALSNAAALETLAQAETLWEEMRTDLDAILASSGDLVAAQSAADAITAGSES